ncbi:glycoside hydrolase superfamily [Aspergillus taichungensis]|uniref:chitinase n=1 Tax=Aspergillus taichungensis TaxID=482145 RepID=A0A2J5HS23_9EURO|nr:glycoside hydrolase superfamily [Aspergillus taichungensis]
MRVNGQGGQPEVDFSTASEDCETFEGTNLKNCPQIGKDIKSCQEKGKTIILSIGGATYSEGGFESESDAKAGAELIWQTFGPSSSKSGSDSGSGSSSSSSPSSSSSSSSPSNPNSSSSPSHPSSSNSPNNPTGSSSKPDKPQPSKSSTVAHAKPAKPTHARPTNAFGGNYLFNFPFHFPTRFHASHLARSENNGAADSKILRPFGDASVDGFDFDFEAATKNMAPFASRLRELADEDASKRIYLTSAPQCPYPDAADKDILNGPVSIDAVFVQFYNNACGLQSFQANSEDQTNFNFDTWDQWARETSQNKNAKVFVGAPANQAAASSGYVGAEQLAQVLKYAQKFDSFGGAMFWDVTQVYSNKGFLDTVVQALGEGQSRAHSWMG